MNTLARSLVPSSSFSLAVPKRQSLWSILGVFLLAITSTAQERPQTAIGASSRRGWQSPTQAPAENPVPDEARITLPTGTRVALVLTHPIDSKSTHHLDEVYCETTAPVTLEDRVAVPAGTFVQGKAEKLTRHGTRGEIVMRSVSIVFADGFVANIGGPKAAMVAAPLVGLGLGTAIGAAAHTTRTINFGGTTMTTNTLKGVAIGSTLGLAAGSVVSLVLLARSHHFYMPIGSALEMVLPQAATLAQGQRADGGRRQGR